ncbi:MAG: hypothetical protein H8K06_05450 [Nitrospira sp.]|nr:hypothetical protein [Nitrospira sp.]
MTDTSSLSHLIERLEKATGPDRELDVEIQETVVGLEMYESIAERGGGKCIRYYPGPPGPTYRALPRYTSSIDAAMTLVPEGWRAGIDPIFFFDDQKKERTDAILCRADWSKWSPVNSDWIERVEMRGATPAIALCIAALKAQLSTRTNEQDDDRNLSGVSSE